jgi:predicted GNAT superfamily acetyltransferase
MKSGARRNIGINDHTGSSPPRDSAIEMGLVCGLTCGTKRPVDGAMTLKENTWRPMQTDDIPAVYALSRRAHVDYPERAAVLAEKLTLFPAGCFVLHADGRVTGYAFSHPWSSAPPSLDAYLGALPAEPTTYFVHDVTLDESARGRGHAAAIVATLVDAARNCGLRQMTLVAVNRSEGFWTTFGFREIGDAALQSAIREKYGPRAVLMKRDL